MYHKRTKHIDVCLHFVRDTIAREYVRIEKISTLINPADMLTKVIPLIKFEQALDLLDILQIKVVVTAGPLVLDPLQN